MDPVLKTEEQFSLRMATVEGSYGLLQYPVLAVPVGGHHSEERAKEGHLPLLEDDLVRRGFRPAQSRDLTDIVIKARPANGSIRCRASTDGRVAVLMDNRMVWSHPLDPNDQETLQWIRAAQIRDITIISGDLVEDTKPECWQHLMTAQVPTTVGV